MNYENFAGFSVVILIMHKWLGIIVLFSVFIVVGNQALACLKYMWL
jgi:hypothetical protein